MSTRSPAGGFAAGALALAVTALVGATGAACGLGVVGTGEVSDGGTGGADVTILEASPAGPDAFTDTAMPDVTVDSHAPVDAHPDSLPDSPSTQDSGSCSSCAGSASGHACVDGGCGCSVSADCPAPNACQSNHVCGPACGPGLACNGGCCSALTCVAFDNGHCGAGAACTPCGGTTPTCGGGVCTGSCGGAGDGTCQGSCCNAGTCAAVGNQTCGDDGKSCTDCTASSAGSHCEPIATHNVCGCDGPPSSDQCPTGRACFNQQCTTMCDGQHPCNGGCCSGNEGASSTCVPACDDGTVCTGNYCQ